MVHTRTRAAILTFVIALAGACAPGDNPSDPGPTTGTIAGIVTDAVSGAPMSGATVVTQPATTTVTTNAQGAYTISNVSTGNYTISASHAGYNTSSTNALVVAATTVTANLALTPQTGTIAGVVTDVSNGQPISGAAVSTQPPTSSATTNAQGAYTLSNVAPGAYTVTASRSGYSPTSATVAATAGMSVTASLALTPLPGNLAGTVTDAISGAALSGATITTQPATVSTTTNAQGGYAINSIPAGTYTITAAHPSHSSNSSTTVVAPGQTATVNLALAPIPGALSGIVTNAANGTPLAGASVSTQPATSTVTTNAQGAYTISNVAPGNYSVTATLTGYNPGTVAAAVVSSQTTTANVSLTPLPGSITGVVTDASNGAPIPGASVSTAPATSTVTTNAQGIYTISAVPPGNYTVTASKTGYTPTSGAATVLPGQAATRNLALSTQPAYAGTWTGTTSDGKTIGFTIVGSAFTQFTFTYNAAACGTTGGTTITYTTPLAISGNTFTISSAGSPPARLAFTTNGTFTSGTTATGTIAITLTLSFPLGNCTTSYNVTWTASR